MNRYFSTSGFSLLLFVAFITSTQSIASLNPDPYRITHGEFQKHCLVLEFNPQQIASASEMFDALTMDFDRTCAAYLIIDSWAQANSGSSVAVNVYSPDFSNKVYADRLMLESNFHIALQTLEEQYFHGLNTILGTQSDAVGSLEKDHLRQRIIGHRDFRIDHDIYGANLDLASLLHNSRFHHITEQDAAIRKILDQYTQELDSILCSLDEIPPNYKNYARVELRSLLDKIESNITIESGTITQLAEQFESTQGYSYQIRNLNKRMTIKIAELLPGKLSDDFTIQVNHNLYAYIFADRQNYTRLLIKARRALPSQPLDKELAECLHALMDAERNAIFYIEPLYDEMLSPESRIAAWTMWVTHRIENTIRSYEDPRSPIIKRYKAALSRYKLTLQPLDKLAMQLLEKFNNQSDQEDGG